MGGGWFHIPRMTIIGKRGGAGKRNGVGSYEVSWEMWLLSG